ncbi:multidrug resistance efflux pump [Pseudomonas sp. GM21]|uniref:HlyD family secretion protein n=1 Tax=Pseudomonas sp. GM21 TaxID=1144325 RepID=UPI0002725309|nr:HlyD family secretion protein [Pseudomonas sp. GM21]EJM24314.1 multidrug resistance efflux pump [Pseudomonas sp. GM21]
MSINAPRLHPAHAEKSPTFPGDSQPQVLADTALDNAVPPARQKVRIGLFLLLPVVLAGCAWLYVTGGQVISTDNAYIQADRVGVSTDVAGIVESIEVTDNQSVTKGQVLYRLRQEPFEIALQSARAQLADVRNQLMNLKASYAQAQAEIAQTQAEIPYYQKNLARLEQLVSVSAVSKTLFDDACHNLEITQQKVAVAKAQAQTILAQLGGRIDSPIEQQPTYLRAQARINEAERNLKNATVTAPFDGIVTNVDSLSPGAYLQPPQSGFSLVASDHLWVAASPKETELTHMREGQPVTITVDSYPGVIWHGRVESISPASGSSFALLPAQNTTGNWVKVVQRIPVRIRIDDTSGKPPLRHGMSVEADIDTGRARGLPQFMAGTQASKSLTHD